mmetsp:Transcript_23257/g.45868  ORF Transcript_23257/g.45868 Transcript_23257/m.45868 type:complete len:256 (-) Transcript_23257:111-878(-)
MVDACPHFLQLFDKICLFQAIRHTHPLGSKFSLNFFHAHFVRVLRGRDRGCRRRAAAAVSLRGGKRSCRFRHFDVRLPVRGRAFVKKRLNSFHHPLAGVSGSIEVGELALRRPLFCFTSGHNSFHRVVHAGADNHNIGGFFVLSKLLGFVDPKLEASKRCPGSGVEAQDDARIIRIKLTAYFEKLNIPSHIVETGDNAKCLSIFPSLPNFDSIKKIYTKCGGIILVELVVWISNSEVGVLRMVLETVTFDQFCFA